MGTTTRISSGPKPIVTCWQPGKEWLKGLTLIANRTSIRFGDLVRYQLKLSSSKSLDISAKLLLKWSVPVTITRIVGPNVVLLVFPDTGVIIRKTNVSQLKPCHK